MSDSLWTDDLSTVDSENEFFSFLMFCCSAYASVILEVSPSLIWDLSDSAEATITSLVIYQDLLTSFLTLWVLQLWCTKPELCMNIILVGVIKPWRCRGKNSTNLICWEIGSICMSLISTPTSSHTVNWWRHFLNPLVCIWECICHKGSDIALRRQERRTISQIVKTREKSKVQMHTVGWFLSEFSKT